VGLAGIALGGGRVKKEDPVDPSQWIYVERKRGERVRGGDVLCRFSHPSDAHAARVGKSAEQIVAEVQRRLNAAWELADAAPPIRPIVLEVIR
jgi:thymidine phosphorylase